MVGTQLLLGACASCLAPSLKCCHVSCLQAASRGCKWVLSLPKTLLLLSVASLALSSSQSSVSSPLSHLCLLPSSSRDCLAHAWTCIPTCQMSVSSAQGLLSPQTRFILLLPLVTMCWVPGPCSHPSPDL